MKSPTSAGIGTSRSIFRGAVELYLSVFVLFYRVAIGWTGRIKTDAAALGLAVVELMFIMTVWTWIQLITHTYIHVETWVLVIAFLAINTPTNYLVVNRGYGLKFEEKFRRFGIMKQIALYLAAIGMVAAVGLAFFHTVESYHSMFGLG